MLQATLTRRETSSHGTFGVLRIFSEQGALLFECFTGELPWKDNQTKMSCIPTGTYKCYRYRSRRYSKAYSVTKVPGRSAILIHIGNFCGDATKGFKTNSEGCILVGMSLGTLRGQRSVLNSTLALTKMIEVVGEAGFTMKVEWGNAD